MELSTRRREQEVWQACDDLWALKGNLVELTGDAIRERLISLGRSRGSPNELYKYRKTWIKSRGLDNADSLGAHPEEQDPISRAVKLVHEQLKHEAADEIERQKREFEQNLVDKEEEISQAKRALNAVLEEFSDLQTKLSAAVSSLKTQEEQLAAEIEIRRAADRELLMVRAQREQEKAAHELLVKELSSQHSQEMSRRAALETSREQQQSALIESILNEKKQLGIEFSDKLNEIKFELYNRDIKTKLLESKLEQAKREAEKLATQVTSKELEIDRLKQRERHLLETLSRTTYESQQISAQSTLLRSETKRLNYALSKAQITIARLRAVFAHVLEQ